MPQAPIIQIYLVIVLLIQSCLILVPLEPLALIELDCKNNESTLNKSILRLYEISVLQ